MKFRKKAAAIAAASIVSAGLLIAYLVHKPLSLDSGDEPARQGIVNPDADKAALSTEATPQLSQQMFKPLPSVGTGSYTERAPTEELKPKDRAVRAQ